MSIPQKEGMGWNKPYLNRPMGKGGGNILRLRNRLILCFKISYLG